MGTLWDISDEQDPFTMTRRSRSLQPGLSSPAPTAPQTPTAPESFDAWGAGAPAPPGADSLASGPGGPPSGSPGGSGASRWTGGFMGYGQDPRGGSDPSAWGPSWDGPPGPETPKADAAPSRDASAYQASKTFRAQVDAINGATDPMAAAQARDKLSRDLFTSLKAAGHDVKWKGDQVMVDGRLYDVAGGQGAKVSDFTTAGGLPSMPNAQGAPAAQASGPGQYAGQLAGFDTTKLNDAAHTTPKYVFARIASKYDVTDPNQRQAMLAELQADPSGYFKNATLGGSKGDKLSIGGALDPKFEGISSFDVVGAAGEGGRNWTWQPEGVTGQGPAQVGSGLVMPQSSGMPSAVAGMPSAAQAAASAASAAPQGQPGWNPTAPSYTPGTLDTGDIPQFSYESLLQQLQAGSPIEGQADQAISDLLANPTGLDDRTVEMMKAKSKDELSEMQQTEDADLTSLGHQMGIADSGWLAAEKAASKGDRDRALVASNRNIDLTAATQRQSDKLAAANLGASYAGQKASQRAQAVTAAMEGALSRSSQIGTRQALQESMNQAATQLGISSDELAQQYVLAKMEDLAKRYGIDVGAAVDYAKLNLADKQFAQDMAFKLYAFDKQIGMDDAHFNANLTQNDAQFGANLGLNTAQLQWLMDQYAMNQGA